MSSLGRSRISVLASCGEFSGGCMARGLVWKVFIEEASIWLRGPVCKE